MILIELSGKQMEIKYDFNSICAVEEIADKPILDVLANARGFNTIRMLVWGGLMHKNPEMTLNYVGNIIQKWIKEGNSLEPLMIKVMEAMKESGVLGDSMKNDEILETGTESDLGE